MTIFNPLEHDLTEDVNLQGSGVTSIPTGVVFQKSLNIEGCAIPALPVDLSVGHDLIARNSLLALLPDNLSIPRSLDIQGTAMTAWPANLSVGSYVRKSGTLVPDVIPVDVTISGSVFVENGETV